MVSIHAPARRATPSTTRAGRTPRSFNPRPRTEGDAGRPSCSRSTTSFNPRPRTEGDLLTAGSGASIATFQSTPPHGGRLDRALKVLLHDVSIHAPARRATAVGEQPGLGVIEVSIHAPARRATQGLRHLRHYLDGFNPRPRTEGDQRSVRPATTPPLFQSTPPHGGRRAAPPSTPAAGGFNPRPRTEGDGLGAAVVELARVSIHAPARRATLELPHACSEGRFQSTPPHGGRPAAA